MANCSMCNFPFDADLRQARWLPSGDNFCKPCLLDVANSSKTSRPELPVLSDDVLLQVFSFLPSRDLLRGARGVCRRWRQLALHSSLWKHRDFPEGRCSWLSAALRLVPRARSVTMNLYWLPLNIWCEVARSTCVFTCVEMSFPCCKDSAALHHGRNILKRQLKTGHLQTLILSHLPSACLREFILMAVNAGLTALQISESTSHSCEKSDQPALSRPDHSQPAPSLKHLKVTTSSVSEPILELVIRSHSSTLQTVDLHEEAVTKSAIAALGSCPQLREAKVSAVEEIAHLDGCPLLTSLTLRDAKDSGVTLPVRFFEGHARRLTALTLCFWVWADDCVEARVMDALRALASSGESALRELSLDYYHCLGAAALRPLPGILHGLPHLHTLEVNGALPVEALDAISIETARNLRLLSFKAIDIGFCLPKCPYPALYRLVQRIPQLHVTGLMMYHDCHQAGGDPHNCDCCESGVHTLLPEEVAETEGEFEHLCLFAHALSPDCGIVHHEIIDFGFVDASCSWLCVCNIVTP